MSEFTEILTSNDRRVLTITLNRPDRLNAWTATMQNEVKAAICAAGMDEAVRCIVITGSGRGFCAGADMKGLQEIAPDGEGTLGPQIADDGDLFPGTPGPDVAAHFAGRFGYLYSCPKPIIAAINGPCAGIGLIFTLYADLRYTVNEAKFTTAFAQRGLIAEHGISWLLPRLIGEARALDLLFSARVFLGDEAAELGLVNKSVPLAEFPDFIDSVARHLADGVSPRSVAVMKRQVRAAYFQSYDKALAIGDREMKASFSTHDFKEGVNSFVERRKPEFTGS
jgi:enoyl-CoA hydratase/carnithine racemase